MAKVDDAKCNSIWCLFLEFMQAELIEKSEEQTVRAVCNKHKGMLCRQLYHNIVKISLLH